MARRRARGHRIAKAPRGTERRSEQTYAQPLALAVIHIGLGNREEAFDRLARRSQTDPPAWSISKWTRSSTTSAPMRVLATWCGEWGYQAQGRSTHSLPSPSEPRPFGSGRANISAEEDATWNAGGIWANI